MTPAILDLAKRLHPSGQLEQVPSRTEPWAQLGECFAAVRRKIESSGGEAVHGWTIWEWPNVLIEAEFHAVWRSPDRQLVDVAVQVPPTQHILFVPTPERVYDGRRVDNVRSALSPSPLVAEYIANAEMVFRMMNRGGRSNAVPIHKVGPVIARQQVLHGLILRAGLRRNDPCYCGSGKKLKRCCGEGATGQFSVTGRNLNERSR